jgi:hypothetical protein
MKREEVHKGLLVRLASAWLDVPPGTCATVDTVGTLSGTWLFTVRWHHLKPVPHKRHRSDRSLNLWEQDLDKFEVVICDEAKATAAEEKPPFITRQGSHRQQLSLPFEEDELHQ